MQCLNKKINFFVILNTLKSNVIVYTIWVFYIIFTKEFLDQ